MQKRSDISLVVLVVGDFELVPDSLSTQVHLLKQHESSVEDAINLLHEIIHTEESPRYVLVDSRLPLQEIVRFAQMAWGPANYDGPILVVGAGDVGKIPDSLAWEAFCVVLRDTRFVSSAEAVKIILEFVRSVRQARRERVKAALQAAKSPTYNSRCLALGGQVSTIDYF